MSRAERLMSLIAFCAVAAFAADTPVGFSNTRGETALSPEVLTNEGIVALADAGFSDAFIAEKIMISNRTRFNTSVDGLAYLRRNGIPQGLVQFVLEHAAQPLTLPGPAAPFAIPVPMQPVQYVQVNAKRRRMQARPALMPGSFVQPTIVPTAVTAPVVVPSGCVNTWQVAAPVYSNSPAYSYVPTPSGYGYYGHPAASYSVPVVTGVIQAVPVAVVAHHWWQ